MGINITHTMGSFQFENRENLRNTARDILNRQGASKENIQKILETPIFDTTKTYPNPQLSIIKASTQISINDSLKETLKYLKKHAATKKEAKKPILGELWNAVNENKDQEYNGELLDFEIDSSIKNIFEAA